MNVRVHSFPMLTLVLSLCTYASSQSAKDTVLGTAGIHLGDTEKKTIYSEFGSVLTVTVLKDGRNHLDRQAVVGLKRPGDPKGYWLATDDRSQTTFVNLEGGTYNIEIGAVGYLTERRDYVVSSGANINHLEVTLQPDPTSIDLNAPLASQMPPKVRKATERALAALKSGDYKRAQKALDNAYKLAPSNSDTNTLLGYLYVQQGKRERALPYLEAAVASDAHNVMALTLLGRLRLQQKDYGNAVSVLKQAVACDSDSWLAHYLLSDAYLQLSDFEKAEQQANLAMVTGKGVKSPLLVLGQGLAGLGRYSEAVEALKEYLRAQPSDPSLQPIQVLLSALEERAAHPQDAGGVIPQLPSMVESPPSSSETDEVRLSFKNWLPPSVDDIKPQVASGVTCPRDQVLDKAGSRAKQLVESVSEYSAIEDLQHETVDELGHPLTREARHYNYLADISELSSGALSVTEFRMVDSRLPEFPGRDGNPGSSRYGPRLPPLHPGHFRVSVRRVGAMAWGGGVACSLPAARRQTQSPSFLSHRDQLLRGGFKGTRLDFRAHVPDYSRRERPGETAARHPVAQ